MSLKRPREDQDDTDLSNHLASSSSLVSPSVRSSHLVQPPIKRPRQGYDQSEHSFLGSLFFSAVGVVRGMIGANPRRAPTHSEMRVQRRLKEGPKLSVGARNVEAQPTGILKELLATTAGAEKAAAGGDAQSGLDRTRGEGTGGPDGAKSRAQLEASSRSIYPTPESSQELNGRRPSSSASGSRTGYLSRSETISTPLLFPPSSQSSFSDLAGHAADEVRGTASQPLVVSDDEDDDSGAKTSKRMTLANGASMPTTPARPPPRRPDLSGHTAPTHTYDWLTFSDAGSSTSARSRSSSTASLRRNKRTASAKMGSPKERAQRKVVNLSWLAGILSDEGDQEGARAIRKELKYVKAGLASASSPSKTIGRLWSKAKKAGGDEKDLYAALLSGPRTLDSVLHKPKPEVFSPELSMKKADYAKSRTAQIVDDIVENFSKAHLAEEAKIKKALDKTVPTPTRMAPERAGEVAAHLRDANFDFRILDKGLRQRDLVTLKPTQWLNDEVINTYLTMVRDRSDRANGADGFKDVYEMSTFFYQKLSQQGYEKAKLARWTKRAKVDIFAKDLILIPVNIGGMHWTAAAINNVARRIEYYDSMGDRGGHRTQVFSNLRKYLREEHQNKKSAPFNEDGWTDHFIAGTPQQDNGSDCGVFTCQTLEALARGRDLTDTSAWDFGHRNMPYIRQLMVLEFGQGKLEKRWPKEQ